MEDSWGGGGGGGGGGIMWNNLRKRLYLMWLACRTYIKAEQVSFKISHLRQRSGFPKGTQLFL